MKTKANFSRVALVAIMMAVMFASCEDDDSVDTKTDELNGSYELYIDDELIVKGTDGDIGMVNNTTDASFPLTISVSEGNDISIVVGNVPTKQGEDSNTEESIALTGSKIPDDSQLAFSTSGTTTRVSETKITFEGILTLGAFPASEGHTFSGYIESDTFKNIKEKM